jgi:ketosteroid isomerase-like protein
MIEYAKTTFFFSMIFWFGTNLQAQENNLEYVTEEIKRITLVEIEAFKIGDCDKAISFMDENITFYGNGRKAPSKEFIKAFCLRLTRPFENPSSVETKYYPLSANSAYVIRTMEFSKDNTVYKKEIVTKVWKKVESGWKIMHLHSTIKHIAEN